jgi:pimeloyl-ACP methyl ester carboxylesterase
MKKCLLFSLLLSATAATAGLLTDKIAERHTILGTDRFYGFERTTFDFRGHTAWVVEPSLPALAARPWTWTMQWADAFVPRTPALHLLRQGWHHVTIDTFRHKMDGTGLAVSKAFQDYLIAELGFSPKACLIGLSWGGFFSTRYAAAHPASVAAIYYDCPLMNFSKFLDQPPEEMVKSIGPWAKTVPADWSADPRMPVNMARAIAEAGIPVFLVYGVADRVVPPETNCELFAPRFRQAGGRLVVNARKAYAHHPHGLEIDDTAIADFFRKAALPADKSADKSADR